MLVLGSLHVGNLTHPYENQAFVTLFGSRLAVTYDDRVDLPSHDAALFSGDVDVATALFQPATLTVSGELIMNGFAKEAWTTLNVSALAGDSSIVVDGQVRTG